MLKKNVGTVDKVLRIGIGFALLAGALAGFGAWMWIGLIPLFTGLFGTCPLYTVFGLRTCPHKGK